MVNAKTRKLLLVVISADFLLVVITNVWLFVSSYDHFPAYDEDRFLYWFILVILLLILWNAIPNFLGYIFWLIGVKKNSFPVWGGLIGYTLLGIGSHFLFQMNLLFNLDGLNEYAGHGGIMYVVSSVLGLVTGAVGIFFGYIFGSIWSKNH